MQNKAKKGKGVDMNAMVEQSSSHNKENQPFTDSQVIGCYIELFTVFTPV